MLVNLFIYQFSCYRIVRLNKTDHTFCHTAVSLFIVLPLRLSTDLHLGRCRHLLALNDRNRFSYNSLI